jgi:hypothetical protein
MDLHSGLGHGAEERPNSQPIDYNTIWRASVAVVAESYLPITPSQLRKIIWLIFPLDRIIVGSKPQQGDSSRLRLSFLIEMRVKKINTKPTGPILGYRISVEKSEQCNQYVGKEIYLVLLNISSHVIEEGIISILRRRGTNLVS